MEWAKLQASEQFQELDDSSKETVRDKYFQDFIEPNLKKEEREKGYQKFREFTGGDIQTSVNASDFGKRIAGSAIESTGQMARGVGEVVRGGISDQYLQPNDVQALLHDFKNEGSDTLKPSFLRKAVDPLIEGTTRIGVERFSDIDYEQIPNSHRAAEILQPYIEEAEKNGQVIDEQTINQIVLAHNDKISQGKTWNNRAGNFVKDSVNEYVADPVSRYGEEIKNDVSYRAKKEIEKSQPTGSIDDLSNVSLGSDPSVAGYSLQAADILGQLIPQMAAAYATRGKTLRTQMASGAAVGSMQSGGAAADKVNKTIDNLSNEELKKTSGFFADVLEMGGTEEQARADLKNAVQREVFSDVARTTAVTGAISGYIFSPLAKMGSNSFAGHVAAKAGSEGITESAEEVLEGYSENQAYNQAGEFDKDPLEGSFGNAVLGFIGGKAAGTGAGVASYSTVKANKAKKEAEKVEAQAREVDELVSDAANSGIENLKAKYSQLFVPEQPLLETDVKQNVKPDVDFTVSPDGQTKPKGYQQKALTNDGVIYAGTDKSSKQKGFFKDGLVDSFNKEYQDGYAETFNALKNSEVKKRRADKIKAFNQQTADIQSQLFSDTKDYLDGLNNVELQNKNLLDLASDFGGVSKQEAIENGVDPSMIAEINRRNPFKPVFSKKGLTFDGLAERLNEANVITPYGDQLDGVRAADYLADVIDGKQSGDHGSPNGDIESQMIDRLPSFDLIRESLGDVNIPNKRILSALKAEKPTRKQKKIIKAVKNSINEINTDLHDARAIEFEASLADEFNQAIEKPARDNTEEVEALNEDDHFEDLFANRPEANKNIDAEQAKEKEMEIPKAKPVPQNENNSETSGEEQAVKKLPKKEINLQASSGNGKKKYYRGQPEGKNLRLNEKGLLWVTPEKKYAEDPHYGGKKGATVLELDIDDSNVFDHKELLNDIVRFNDFVEAGRKKGVNRPLLVSAANGDFRALQDSEVVSLVKQMGYKGFVAIEPEGQESLALFSLPEPKNEIDEAANAAEINPTEAQKEAGNYKKGHTKFQGLDIAIENPKGSTRSGTDSKGNKWENKIHQHYGYIKRTEGADGDQVDVFIGDNPESDKVFVIDQVDQNGKFDEHKVMLGFNSSFLAKAGYKKNYQKGWKVGPITEMNVADFKSWLKNGDTKKKVETAETENKEKPLMMSGNKPSKPPYNPNLRKEMNAFLKGRNVELDGSGVKWFYRDKDTKEKFTLFSEKEESAQDKLDYAYNLMLKSQGKYTKNDEFAAQKDTLEVEAKNEAEKTKTVKPKAKSEESKNSKANNDNAELSDFGEKIGGSRKDEAEAIKFFNRSFTKDDYLSLPLSKIWPKKEVDSIEDPELAALMFALRDEIPNKPRSGFKRERWAKQISELKQAGSELLGQLKKGDVQLSEIIAKSAKGNRGLESLASRVELLKLIDRADWSRVKHVAVRPDSEIETGSGKSKKTHEGYIQIRVDNRYKLYPGVKTIADAISAIKKDLASKEAPKLQFEIRGRKGSYFINKKGDSEYRVLKVFTDLNEARKYKSNNHDELVGAWEAVKDRDNVKKRDVRSKENRERVGKDYRKGKDVTPEMFSDAFGFRGVEFGKWVKQGKSNQERQSLLNNTYDSLMDLASILNIPSRALSLDGRLGLGLGSRGNGGRAAAHFEVGYFVINLTKTKGAGSLAHEWFHALDNYFVSFREMKDPKDDKNHFITYKPEPLMRHKTGKYLMTKNRLKARQESHPETGYFKDENWEVDPNYSSGVRPTVEKAFANLVQKLDESPMRARSLATDKNKPNGYWSDVIERAARSFESYVISKMDQKGFNNDFLANVQSIEDFPRSPLRYPYLLAEELPPVEAAFDELFNSIKVKDNENKTLYRKGDDKNLLSEKSFNNTAKIIQGIFKSAPITFKFRESSLDKAVREKIKKDDHSGNVKGIYTGDKIFIIGENHDSIADVTRTVLHETVAHYGLKQLLGDSHGDFIQQAWEGMNKSERLKVAARHKLKMNNKAAIAEEYIAEIAETNKNPSLLDRLITAVKKILKPIIDLGVSNADIRVMLQRSKINLMRSNEGKKDSSRSAAYYSLKNDGRNEKKWQSVEKFGSKPRYEGDDFVLKALAQLETKNDFSTKQHRLDLGHAAHVDKGVNAWQFVVVDKYEQNIGILKAQVDPKSNEIVGIHDIEMLNKGRGLGEKIVSTIIANSSKPVKIIEMLDSSWAFWQKMGAERRDQYKNGSIEWEQYSRAIAGRVAQERLGAGEENASRPGNQENAKKDRGTSELEIDESQEAGVEDGWLYRTSPVEDSITPSEKWYDALLRKFQDKYINLKRTQQAIESNGDTISDESNVYEKETLMHGKVEQQLKTFEKDYIIPLTRFLKQNNIEPEELDLFLYAKHAPERNKALYEFYEEQGLEDISDSLSGMSDQDAANILSEIRQDGRYDSFESAASNVYLMLKHKRELLKDNGLLSDEESIAWESKYKNYVPLKGFASDEAENSKGFFKKLFKGENPFTTKVTQKGHQIIGRGFAIKGAESLKALGRRTTAGSILAHTLTDVAAAKLRAEKNNVAQSLLKLVKENPDNAYWSIHTKNTPPTIKSRKTGLLVEMNEREMANSDEFVPVKKNGEQYYIRINDPELVAALKNMGLDEAPKAIQVMGKINRYLSTMSTSLSPDFVVSNFFRDLQTGLFNAAGETTRKDGKLKQGNVKDLFSLGALKGGYKEAVKAIYKIERGGEVDPNNEWSKAYNEFLEGGAKTGFFDSKTVEEQAADFKRLIEIEKGTRAGKTMKYSSEILKFVEDLNASVENTTRLVAYKYARDTGLTKQKAAVFAKDLTVNFNRRGKSTTWLNALFMFANASIQGSANFMRSLGQNPISKNPLSGKREYTLTGAQAMGIAMAGSGYLFSMLARAIGGEADDGEDWIDKVPDHVTERNMVFFVPFEKMFSKEFMENNAGWFGKAGEKTYIKIPLPYGYNIFHNVGTGIEQATNGSSRKSNTWLAKFLTFSVLGSFSPIGTANSEKFEYGAIKTIAPTVLKPIADMALNENYFGSPIYQDRRFINEETPDSATSKRRTWDGWKSTAELINEITGGSKYKKGAVDIAPESFEYLFKYATGGFGTFIENLVKTKESALDENKDTDVRSTPIVRKLVGKVNSYQSVSDFYDRLDKVEMVRKEYLDIPFSEKRAFSKKNREALELASRGKSYKASIKQLREQINRYKAIKAPNDYQKSALKNLEDQQRQLIDDFNKRYNALRND